jgi:bifunctional DNase/RNase
MELLGVRLEPPANYPVMLLREKEGLQRLLPVYIGGPEAAAISYVLEGVETPRPLTHDLLKIVLGELNANLTNVVITELREHTFYAELHLKTGNGDRVISSRPSDAVALALRTGSPIFVSEAVLAEAGQTPEAEEEPSPEILEEFRDFIEHVNPDDFAGS